jgi:beta-lactamase regulating signal transducer with metallopeptidase domain
MDLALWLADWTLKSTVLFVAAGVLTVVLRYRSAGLRHLVWGLALGAALILPLASLAAPRWSPPLALPMPGAGEAGWTGGAVATEDAAAQVSTTLSSSALSLPSALNQTSTPAPSGSVASDPASVPSRSMWVAQVAVVARRVAGAWTSWLVALWGAGGLLVLSALGLAILRTRRLRQMGRPAPAEAQTLARLLAARLDLRRPVSLLAMDGNVMPMTFGVLHPVVLIPVAAAGWSDDRLRAVLLHELSHVKRLDCLTHLVARVTCAMYWFNPLAWVAARRLRIERELACDDLVLSAGSRASEYATHLLDIARGLRVGALAGAAGIAMARPSQLAGRLLAVLDASRARDMVTGRLAAGSLAAALMVMVPLAGARTWEEVAPVPAERTAEAAAPAATQAPRFSARSALSAVNSHATQEPTVVAEPEARRSVSALMPRWLPVQSAACAWNPSDRSTSASHNANDDQFTIRIKVGACSLRVDGEGEVTFSDNDDDVTALSRGGFFHIEERGGDVERRVEIERGTNGLERKWFVDGKERPYDAEARAWLARTLLVMFRRTGFDAENRAQRLLQKGGVEAVLQEVAFIRSDWAARQYYQVLLTQPNLDQAALLRVVRQAGREIDSDFELAELLTTVAEHQPLEENVRLAYVEAVGSIRSDFERHRALKPVLTRQGISREMAAAMLQSAKSIGSDFELAGLLIEITEAHAIDATLAPAFFDALASVSSDLERHRVLTAVARQAKGDQAVLDRALEASAAMRSDFELASFLSEVSTSYPPERPLPPAFLRAAATINSGFELRRALSGVVTRGGATPAQLATVLDAAAGITSDFELAELLVTIARQYPLDEALRPAFFAAAGHIRGDFEHARTLKAVIAKPPLTEPTVLALLESAQGIQSDFELAEVLIATSKAFQINERVRPAFLKAAESLSSEHERGRVLSAIFPRSAPAQ